MSKNKKTEDNTSLNSIGEPKVDSNKLPDAKLPKEWESDDIDDEEENTDQKGFDRTVD